MIRLLGTFFYSGLLRPGPGTWGSLAALAAGLGLHRLGGPLLLALAAAALFPAGLAVTRRYVALTGRADPGELVIDEVVGQWIALLPVSLGAAHAGAPLAALWPGIVTAFLAFRLFDIWKPGPVGAADRRGDPMGVMLDDVWAGLFAGIVVVLMAWLSHGAIGL